MAKIDNTLVSVVVPVYNVEKYIDECIMSIVSQTHPNIELVLVDDGATDKSGLYCDLWAKKDKRIRVIHKKENQGLFRARVSGLEVTHGAYFIFVDSDDYLEKDYIKTLLSGALASGADMVISSYFRRVNDKGAVEGNNVKLPDMHSTTNVLDGFMDKLGTELWGWCVWGKMYKRKLYTQNSRFLDTVSNKINAAEDALFSIIFASSAKHVFYTEPYAGYYYRQNNQSIMRGGTTQSQIAKLESFVAALSEINRFLENCGMRNKCKIQLESFRSHLFDNFVWSIQNEHSRVMDKVTGDLAEQVRINYELREKIKNILESKTYRAGRMMAYPYIKLRERMR